MKIMDRKLNKGKKNSTVYTPDWLVNQIYNIIKESGIKTDTILDPCIGKGALIKPFNNSKIIGIDLKKEDDIPNNITFISGDFEEIDLLNNNFKPDLVIMNPPWNGHPKRKLYPEVFLNKIIETYGKDIPIVIISGYNLWYNVKSNSKRLRYYSNMDLRITSQIILPLDTFDNVLFPSCVTFINIPNIKPMYWPDVEKCYN